MASRLVLVQNRRKFVSLDQAVQEVVNHNDRMISSPSDIEAEAIRRLFSALENAKYGSPNSKAENIVDLVKDLDVVFFGGVLWGHIDVSWGGPGAFWNQNLDTNHTLGFATSRSPGQCKIYLSVERILTIPGRWHSFKQAWSTTLHEMAHALTMVRCVFRGAGDLHHSHFRTTIHAVDRHSIQRFGVPAVGSWEGAYKHNHFMSDRWALDEPSGDVRFDITSLQDRHIPNYHPTTDEPRATSHRSHGRNDDAATDKKQKKTYNGNVRGKRDELVPSFNNENGRKKHSKTRDNGYRKHDDLTDHIKAKYPQGAFVRTRGEPTCTVM